MDHKSKMTKRICHPRIGGYWEIYDKPAYSNWKKSSENGENDINYSNLYPNCQIVKKCFRCQQLDKCLYKTPTNLFNNNNNISISGNLNETMKLIYAN